MLYVDESAIYLQESHVSSNSISVPFGMEIWTEDLASDAGGAGMSAGLSKLFYQKSSFQIAIRILEYLGHASNAAIKMWHGNEEFLAYSRNANPYLVKLKVMDRVAFGVESFKMDVHIATAYHSGSSMNYHFGIRRIDSWEGGPSAR